MGVSFQQCEYSSVPPALHTEKLHKASAIFEVLGKIIWEIEMLVAVITK